jgi:hypothetical protein
MWLKMSMLAEHVAKSHNFSTILKQVKNSQTVKSLNNHFRNLQKQTISNFYFSSSSPPKKFFASKTLKSRPKRISYEFLIQSHSRLPLADL